MTGCIRRYKEVQGAANRAIILPRHQNQIVGIRRLFRLMAIAILFCDFHGFTSDSFDGDPLRMDIAVESVRRRLGIKRGVRRQCPTAIDIKYDVLSKASVDDRHQMKCYSLLDWMANNGSFIHRSEAVMWAGRSAFLQTFLPFLYLRL